jgi:hypothetical protein
MCGPPGMAIGADDSGHIANGTAPCSSRYGEVSRGAPGLAVERARRNLQWCTRKPDVHLPRTPEGCVCVQEVHAAGGFSGWTIRPATLEEREAIARARAIRAAAMGDPFQADD